MAADRVTLSGERTFKFLEEKHVPSLLSGTFLFRRLRYYQLLEMCTGDQDIGDKGEGNRGLYQRRI